MKFQSKHQENVVSCVNFTPRRHKSCNMSVIVLLWYYYLHICMIIKTKHQPRVIDNTNLNIYRLQKTLQFAIKRKKIIFQTIPLKLYTDTFQPHTDICKMTAYTNLKTFLGYGGNDQSEPPPFNHQRTGLRFPPTHRELLHCALHLSDMHDGKCPKEDLIK